MDESEKLAELYRQKAVAGLVDVKFTLVDIHLADYETVCREVLAMEAALPSAKPLTFGDSRRAH